MAGTRNNRTMKGRSRRRESKKKADKTLKTALAVVQRRLAIASKQRQDQKNHRARQVRIQAKAM